MDKQLRRWSVCHHRAFAIVVSAALIAVVLGALAVIHDRDVGGDVASSASSVAVTQTTSRPEPPQGTARDLPVRRTGSIADPIVGVAYPFRLLNHCGIRFTVFGGRTWLAVHPDPDVGPPQADAGGTVRIDGYIAGTMTLLDDQYLQFIVNDPYHAVKGTVIEFRPTARSLPLCA